MLAALASASAHAYLFDDFSDGLLDIQVEHPTTLVTGSRAGSMAGGIAFHYVNILDNPLGNGARLRVKPSTGLMISHENSVRSESLTGYGVDPLGNPSAAHDLNLNLTDSDRFRVHFYDLDLPLDLIIYLYNAEPNGSYSFNSFSQTVSPGSNFSADVMFANFPQYDFADLDVVGFCFLSSASGDVSIRKIEAVPEPATLFTVACGAAAVLRRRKLRRVERA